MMSPFFQATDETEIVLPHVVFITRVSVDQMHQVKLTDGSHVMLDEPKTQRLRVALMEFYGPTAINVNLPGGGHA